MKRAILSLILIVITQSIFAQDIITFTDGKSVKAKVLEITQTEIKYKKYSNLDGPLYTINKNTVMQIKYKGGDVEEFSNEPTTSSSTNSNNEATNTNEPQLIELGPDENNAEIIRCSKYGKNGRGDMFPKRNIRFKAADYVTAKLVFTASSVVSNGEVTIRHMGNNIAIINNTDDVIYVDLGNSFSTDKFATRCYHDPTKVVSFNDSQTSGGSLNLGAITGIFGIGGIVGRLASGINVGSASSGGTTTTYSTQRYIIVPPGGTGWITKWESHDGKTALEGENFKQLFKSVGINKNDSKVYNETNSPIKRDYFITYSTSPEFKTYSVLRFSVYVHQLIGASSVDTDIPNGICTVTEYIGQY